MPVASLAAGFGFGALCFAIPMFFVAAHVIATGKVGLLSADKVYPLPLVAQSGGGVQRDVKCVMQQPPVVNADDAVIRTTTTDLIAVEAGTSTTDLIAVVEQELFSATPKGAFSSALPLPLVGLPSSKSVAVGPGAWSDAAAEQKAVPALPVKLNCAHRAKLPPLPPAAAKLELGSSQQQKSPIPQAEPTIAFPTLLAAPRAAQPPPHHHSNSKKVHPEPESAKQAPSIVHVAATMPASSMKHPCPQHTASVEPPSDDSRLRALAKAAKACVAPPIVSWHQQEKKGRCPAPSDNGMTKASQMDLPDRHERKLVAQLYVVQNNLAMTQSECAAQNIPGVPGLRKVEFSQRLLNLSEKQRELQKQLREVSAAKAVAKAEQQHIKVQPPLYARGSCMSQVSAIQRQQCMSHW